MTDFPYRVDPADLKSHLFENDTRTEIHRRAVAALAEGKAVEFTSDGHVLSRMYPGGRQESFYHLPVHMRPLVGKTLDVGVYVKDGL